MAQSPNPKPLSREEFVQALVSSGLFSPDQLDKALADVSPMEGNTDGPGLARQLTAAGKLTPFQAEGALENRPQELIIGNYTILAQIGVGGMGAVFKGRHRRMKRVVAIKVLSKSGAQDENFRKRFQREVVTVARLSHPNIVMAFDADESEAGPFLVMEFVNGRDLATHVKENGPLSLRDAVDCILQAVRGLAYAHSQNIVHRDIKPANLLLDESGVVKVADLGLARLIDSLNKPATGLGTLTQVGSVLGTVGFMAPEQADASTTLDHRADVYSLGCTLYFLLTGKPPFMAKTVIATLLEHRTAPIPSLRSIRPGAPAALDVLFKHMLAKQPAERRSSMAEIVSVLEVLLPKLAQTALEPSPATGGVIAPSLEQNDQPSTQLHLLASLNVLLVESSRTQATIVRSYLPDLGIKNVTTIASGVKALQSIQALPPQVVISANHLDDGTGIQLARKVRGERALAKVGFILISSEGDSVEMDKLVALPRTVMLRKPFDLQKLNAALLQATT